MNNHQSIDPLLEAAHRLDDADELRDFRSEFHLPVDDGGTPLVYLCGHSLGLQPKDARRMVEDELATWARLGVEGHFSGERPWVSYHERLAPKLAALAGAGESEVVAMNSLTVNLHLALASFYRPVGERRKILIEAGAFPSDRYAVASQIRLHGLDPDKALLEIGPRDGETLLRHDDVCEAIERDGESIATVLLPAVNYLTGQAFDLKGIAAVARKNGCAIGFDLAHAIGNVRCELNASDCDFAVWCGYKYLNGGPGAIGGLFVHERHAHAFELPRLAGWWGHQKETRFAMPQTYVPLVGAEGWQVSNPPILAMAPLMASLNLFERATQSRLRAKSGQLTNFLVQAIATRLSDKARIVTPADSDMRGSQLSLILNIDTARARQIRARLKSSGVVCDWREPNVLRVAPVPLYNTYNDAWRLVSALEEIFA